MTTRLSRILIDRRNGVPGVTTRILEEVIADFRVRRLWITQAWGEITVDDLNGTAVKRLSVVLRDGTRFALSGLEEPLALQPRARTYPYILLTMVSCRRTCFGPDWCGHPTQLLSVLNNIRHDLTTRIHMAESTR